MSATFEQLWNELLGWVPKLEPLAAQKVVNRAWIDIQDSRLWSFAVMEGSITIPADISSGAATVTQDSATVVMDATATAALNAVGAGLLERQFRVGLSSAVYNIQAWDGAGNLTLERAFGEISASSQVYHIYQCYYPPPATDFLRWISIVNVDQKYPLECGLMKCDLDRVDPGRGFTGQPYRVATYRTNPAHDSGSTFTGEVMFELWPHPVTHQTLQCLYQRKSAEFSGPTAILPDVITTETLMDRAKYKAYEWAMANQGKHPDLKGIPWLDLIKAAKLSYEEGIQQNIRNDEETFQQLRAGSYLYSQLKGLTMNSSYMINHAPIYTWPYVYG